MEPLARIKVLITLASVLQDSSVEIVKSGTDVPRVPALMEPLVRTLLMTLNVFALPVLPAWIVKQVCWHQRVSKYMHLAYIKAAHFHHCTFGLPFLAFPKLPGKYCNTYVFSLCQPFPAIFFLPFPVNCRFLNLLLSSIHCVYCCGLCTCIYIVCKQVCKGCCNQQECIIPSLNLVLFHFEPS